MVILKAGGVNGDLGGGLGRRLRGLGRRALLGCGRPRHREQHQQESRQPHAISRSSTRVEALAAGGRRLEVRGIDLQVTRRRPAARGGPRPAPSPGSAPVIDANSARSMPSASRNPIINASSTRSCPHDQRRLRRAVALALRPASSQSSGPLVRRVARLASGRALGEAAVRAGPDADVILIPPIDQIMAAGSARPRMVGDLVGRQARGLEPRLGELEHRARLLPRPAG